MYWREHLSYVTVSGHIQVNSGSDKETAERNKLYSTEVRHIELWTRQNEEGENKENKLNHIHILSFVHMQQGK